MKKELCAYLAGLLDGDGSIYFIIRKNSIEPKIVFSNTSKQLIEDLKDLIPLENIVYWEKHPKNKNARISYYIRIEKAEALKTFLENIVPYLRRKRRQAELMLEYVTSRLERRKIKGTVHYSEREKEIAKEVKKLNRRGKLIE